MHKLFYFIGGVVGVCLGVSWGGVVHAEQPTWVVQELVDTRAFRSVLDVPVQDIEVPTVVEVPVPTGYVQNRQAVAVSEEGDERTPVLFVSDRVEQDVPVTLSGTMPGANFSVLSDERLDTSVDFPFEEGAQNSAYITVVADEPITTSELRIALAQNVSLPRTVSIQTTEGEMITGTVVATRPLEGTVVRFPETTARQFTVTFECVQPLRLAEFAFVQVHGTDWTEAVRFLAQPHTSYQVYLDPDRAFGDVVGQAADLRTSTGVREISSGTVRTNPSFSPADSDTDGVADERDNCVQVVNPDQTDIDRNARGDACDDFDRDGILNAVDNCPDDPNWGQEDTDGDEQGDVCDLQENRFTERNRWVPWFGLGVAALVLIGLFGMTVRDKTLLSAARAKEEVVEQEGE
jgi:Thrombospondin type 3 repeat